MNVCSSLTAAKMKQNKHDSQNTNQIFGDVDESISSEAEGFSSLFDNYIVLHADNDKWIKGRQSFKINLKDPFVFSANITWIIFSGVEEYIGDAFIEKTHVLLANRTPTPQLNKGFLPVPHPQRDSAVTACTTAKHLCDKKPINKFSQLAAANKAMEKRIQEQEAQLNEEFQAHERIKSKLSITHKINIETQRRVKELRIESSRMTWKHGYCATQLVQAHKREHALGELNQKLQTQIVQAQESIQNLRAALNGAAAYMRRCNEQTIVAQANTKQALEQLDNIKSKLEAERKNNNKPRQRKLGSAFTKVTSSAENGLHIIGNNNPTTLAAQFSRQELTGGFARESSTSSNSSGTATNHANLALNTAFSVVVHPITPPYLNKGTCVNSYRNIHPPVPIGARTAWQ
ncbi:hypothetical protein H4R20_003907 [Coemansia guatemalensis]|uniref:Uncharacterized protein n=1 Tax=Coemansia guatemalensis TaxID=2761395 RepID=A0A9W8LS83_9FUNG|nr:hypothetical protein H4R20_003907 [Coemansia guatemalensis]